MDDYLNITEEDISTIDNDTFESLIPVEERTFNIDPKFKNIKGINIQYNIINMTGHGPRIKVRVNAKTLINYPISKDGYVLFNKLETDSLKYAKINSEITDYVCGISSFCKNEIYEYSKNGNEEKLRTILQNAINNFNNLPEDLKKKEIEKGKRMFHI